MKTPSHCSYLTLICNFPPSNPNLLNTSLLKLPVVFQTYIKTFQQSQPPGLLPQSIFTACHGTHAHLHTPFLAPHIRPQNLINPRWLPPLLTHTSVAGILVHMQVQPYTSHVCHGRNGCCGTPCWKKTTRSHSLPNAVYTSNNIPVVLYIKLTLLGKYRISTSY